jgi:hypothetical protein
VAKPQKISEAEIFFAPWEYPIRSWHDAITILGKAKQKLSASGNICWRGVKKSSYGFHGSLHRALGADRFPVKESELIRAEKSILEFVEKEWRTDGKNPLSLLADLQHYGGETRLIDATLDPYIALWFACEYLTDPKSIQYDGRVIAVNYTNRQIQFTNLEGKYELPWHRKPNPLKASWHTGSPVFWIPPISNSRIEAQKAGFLIGGIPRTSSGSNCRYRKQPGVSGRWGNWKIDEVRRVTSVNLFLNLYGSKQGTTSYPAYVFRIEKKAKAEILEHLDKVMGINFATLFPDIEGKGQFSKLRMLEIMEKIQSR